MLEIRNVTKVYRSKTGEEVLALDRVSVSFPESGMVFILGKSGSGKSTLLNVMGGLDSYDSGEFVIMGKSSGDFVGSDFDAYRNTFIGFIFQEYNILDDFTVGANIGLALELQGKKATDEAINAILAKVDLLDYAKRKPNELSGGQKQRVAIARALVKDPQIIMADEPTGALDSNTGKQIFDTLKELSREKLVLIVSHDRDFAERYADRIIELADGKIVDDVTKHEHHAERLSEGVHRINDRILRIEQGYRLTAKDLEMINAYLAGNNGDVLLSGDTRVNTELRSAAGISEDGGTTVFENTKAEDHPLKKYDKEKTGFIRSKLPMKNAVKMGSSGLKHKKFRLVITVFLALISFAMFGLADTMAAYNKLSAATDSIQRAQIKTASFALYLRETQYYDGKEKVSYRETDSFNEQDLAAIAEKTGLSFLPVFTGSSSAGRTISFSSYFLEKNKDSHLAYPGSFSGFVALDEAKLAEYGFTLTGSLPTERNQLVITKHTYDQFAYYGYQNGSKGVNIKGDVLNMQPDAEHSIIGQKLELQIGRSTATYTIVGVLDTGFDTARYASFLPSAEGGNGGGNGKGGDEGMLNMMMQKELANVLSYDFHCLGILSQGTIQALSASVEQNYRDVGAHLNGMNLVMYATGEQGDSGLMHLNKVAGNSALPNLQVTWLDGTTRTQLADNEIVISREAFERVLSQIELTPELSELSNAASGLWSAYANTDAQQSVAWRIREAILQAQPSDSAARKAEYAKLWNSLVETLQLPSTGRALSDDAKAQIVMDAITRLANQGKIEFWHLSDARLLAYVQCELMGNDYELVNSTAFLEDMRSFYTQYRGSAEQFDQNLQNCDTMQEKSDFLEDIYLDYLKYEERPGYVQNPYGVCSGKQLEDGEVDLMMHLCSVSVDQLSQVVYYAATTMDWDRNGNQTTSNFGTYTDWKLVGIHDRSGDLLISEGFNTAFRAYAVENDYSIYEYAPHESGIYSHVVAPMPTDEATLQKLVELSYLEEGNVAFKLQNHVMDTLDIFNEFVEPGAKIFLFVGLGFAFFASLLLMNFIATSISYKKRDIGVLRAVGARSSDVFKIFFSESAIIALINFVLSVIAAAVATSLLNNWMANEGIAVKLLNFGIRQVVLMLGVSILVAILASFFPVYKIAKKKPVDAIKDR